MISADPNLIFDTATAFWRSSVLFTACELGVFDRLDSSSGTATDIANRLNASERGVLALLDSCTAMGLLHKEGAVFHNSETAGRYLTSTGSESLVVTLGLQSATYPMWAKLAQSVKSGKPVMPPGDMLGGNPELTRRFVVGMHQRALGVARCLVNEIDLSGRSLLADIGGGPGTYSVLLAQKYPGLRAKVMDLAPVLKIARDLIDKSGVGDRIETVSCDARKDDFGTGYDVALVSGLLHRMTTDECRSILKRVYNALSDGGLIVVNDLFSTGEKPEMAILFGLQMLLTTETGKTHAASDIVSWFETTGFKNVKVKTLPPPLPHTLVIGEKVSV